MPRSRYSRIGENIARDGGDIFLRRLPDGSSLWHDVHVEPGTYPIYRIAKRRFSHWPSFKPYYGEDWS